MALTRREFILRSFGAMGAATLAFDRFGLTSAFAQATDYKALVCIFLFGGSDQNNILIPYDNYADYAAVRATPATLGIAQSSLAQTVIRPPSLGSAFALHPALRTPNPSDPNLPGTGLHQLFVDGKAAMVCNVGPLVEPTSQNAYLNRTVPLPNNLFSHSDQQNEWQTAIAHGFISTGWGGRLADKVAAYGFQSSSGFPLEVSVAGSTIFSTGSLESAVTLSPAPTPLNTALRLDGFPNPADSDPRYQAMLDLQQLDDGYTLVRTANQITGKGVNIVATLRTVGNPVVAPFPLSPTTGLANQLEQVAKLVSLRSALGITRQIFFCSLGGFDTHNGQVNGADASLGTHAGLWTQVSNAIQAFYQATLGMGVADQVTTFTMSDFSRTFGPNGTTGSDHAWASHHFVVGGAVKGGDCYGLPGSNGTVFPTLALSGPDDTDQGGGARGRWIPTASVDQYGATLASWFGVSSADMPAVFPNIGSFGSADLKFMK